jgi:hypothetical protein
MGAPAVVMALAKMLTASFGVIPVAVVGVVFRRARIAFPVADLLSRLLTLIWIGIEF